MSLLAYSGCYAMAVWYCAKIVECNAEISNESYFSCMKEGSLIDFFHYYELMSTFFSNLMDGLDISNDTL